MKRLIAIASGNKYSTERNLPVLYNEHHVPVTTHCRKLEIHSEHSSKLELADDMSVDQLVQRYADVGLACVDSRPP